MDLDTRKVVGAKRTATPRNYSVSGYGNKIPTSWLLQLQEGNRARWHRVYVICYSNAGSAYVRSRGERLMLGSYDPGYDGIPGVNLNA
jgi:hypothetical protein